VDQLGEETKPKQVTVSDRMQASAGPARLVFTRREGRGLGL
jgi:hypothetical protein